MFGKVNKTWRTGEELQNKCKVYIKKASSLPSITKGPSKSPTLGALVSPCCVELSSHKKRNLSRIKAMVLKTTRGGMKEAHGVRVQLRDERDYKMKKKDEKCEEEEQAQQMGVGRLRRGKNVKRMRGDGTKERERED